MMENFKQLIRLALVIKIGIIKCDILDVIPLVNFNRLNLFVPNRLDPSL